ncbi:hypothetical protein [Vibrio fluvialis]|uniref:hypothetical protein n=1 Tax=Vibrio fluvialis TaxID=676 RepID=UPI00056F60DD|nr:hypothetical protein [Vibrio fluvialis]
MKNPNFLREEVAFNEGDLIEIKKTGERFLFGSAEYAVNWRYRVHDKRGNYWGQLNKGELVRIKRAEPELGKQAD